MALKIKAYVDFICPFCYIGKHLLDRAIAGRPVDVEYYPYELRSETEPPIDPLNDPQKVIVFDRYIQPHINVLNLDMKLPMLSPHPYTRLAFEGYHFAKDHDKGVQYFNAVFDAFFKHEKNIGRISVLTHLADSVGLDPREFRYALENGTYSEVERHYMEHARDQEITSVPTYMIGMTVLRGLQPQEELERIIDGELSKLKNNEDYFITM